MININMNYINKMDIVDAIAMPDLSKMTKIQATLYAYDDALNASNNSNFSNFDNNMPCLIIVPDFTFVERLSYIHKCILYMANNIIFNGKIEKN
jgi:hypothetical protein